MPAAYDNYDYPSYWEGRGYEHESELIALSTLLDKIPEVKKSLEIGGGFGRLVQSYSFRVKKVILTDPSAKLLSMARKNLKKEKNIEYLQTSLENILQKTKVRDYDLAIMVRVLHHINDIDEAFKTINKIIKKNGYFILEFANKRNLKATARHLIKGDITFPMEIHPVDLRSKKNVKKKTLPFINYHPDQVLEKLKKSGFEIVHTLSVSNIRSSLLKRVFPIEFLLEVEKKLQGSLSGIKFGPSIFVLAKKKG